MNEIFEFQDNMVVRNNFNNYEEALNSLSAFVDDFYGDRVRALVNFDKNELCVQKCNLIKIINKYLKGKKYS